MKFKFCPECGQKLVDRPAGDDGNVPWCDSCARYWFDQFASCVIGLVVNEYNEIALLRQNYLSDRYWGYVAGFMKPGETAEETMVREIEEELGLQVEALEYGGTYWFDQRDQLMHGFIASVRKKDFILSSEVNQARWVSLEEAPALMFPPRPGSALYPLLNQLKTRLGQEDGALIPSNSLIS